MYHTRTNSGKNRVEESFFASSLTLANQSKDSQTRTWQNGEPVIRPLQSRSGLKVQGRDYNTQKRTRSFCQFCSFRQRQHS